MTCKTNGTLVIEDKKQDPDYVRMEDIRATDNYFKKVRGSDPRAATCRGKLQYRRSKLNQELNKQMMIRSGAEKLFKATVNKKLKETVALELSFVNSNLQLLKEQLAELNSSVQMYQGESSAQLVPMIPMGLKETKDIDFKEPFKDFILEHYSEDYQKYESQIQELVEMRAAIRTPTRDKAGVQLLFQYYNHLYFVDRRFFSPNRSLGIFFEWFDSLTGVPSTQKTIAFEKASILFNIAALYTQIGAKQDRSKSIGIDSAVDSFLRAAGMFRYIRENFSNAPSMDLAPDTLDTLTHLMLAQARECLFEKLALSVIDKQSIEVCLDTAQEAAEVAEVFREVHKHISTPPVKDYVPYSWISLIFVKSEHYRALAHYYIAVGLLDHPGKGLDGAQQLLEFIHCTDETTNTCIDIRVPKNSEEQRQLGKAHLREAVLLHEEALRRHRMCRQLRQVDTLQSKLRAGHDAALNRYADVEDEDDFQEVLDPPQIQAATKYQLTLTPPDMTHYKVKDLFHDLGPLSIFSARHYWTAPRNIQLEKTGKQTFGFSVRGDAPVIVAGVDQGSMAQIAGMKEGDFIVAIGDKDTKWSTHEDVVTLIRNSNNKLSIKVITPVDRNYLYPQHKSSPNLSPSYSTSSGGSPQITQMGSTKSKLTQSQKKLTWNFFKRASSKERERHSSSENSSIVLR